MELHGLEHKLHRQLATLSGDLGASAEHREHSGLVTVLLLEVPEDFVEDGSPDRTDSVDGGEPGGADGGVEERVGGERSGVGVLADPGSVGPFTHAVVGVAGIRGLETDGSGEPITPAFTHTTSLGGRKTRGSGRTTGETVGKTVGVLVDDNTSLEVTITLDAGACVPDIHAHTRARTINRGKEVGVVVTSAVLGVQLDGVVALPKTRGVDVFEVTGRFRETKDFEEIVVDVGEVEELGDGGVDVGFGVGGRGGVGEVEGSAGGAVGAVVVEVVGATVEVLVGDTHVAAGGVGGVPATGGGLDVVGVGEDLAGTIGRIVDTKGTGGG